MDLATVKTSLEAALTGITGVSEWGTFNLGILPPEAKGIITLDTAESRGQVTALTYNVGLAVADTTPEAVDTRLTVLGVSVIRAIANGQLCTGGAPATLAGPLQFSGPESYPQQGSMSRTDAWRNVCAFQVTVFLNSEATS